MTQENQDAGGNIHDPEAQSTPTPPAPSTPPAPTAEPAPTPVTPPTPVTETEIVAAQQEIDDRAAELADFDAKVAARRLEFVQAHKDAVDAHAKVSARTYDPATHIGIQDHAGNASYLALPKGEEPKSRQLLIAGANYEHVAEDAQGVWLYRRM